jgi:hypothetical protein
MKKVSIGVVVLLFCAIPSFGALDVTSVKIDRLQGDGMTAVYDHTTQTLTWGGGASVALYAGTNATGNPVATFNQGINIHGTFTVLDDDSSGTVAKASFAAIDWGVSVNGNDVIWGTQKAGEFYVEEEQYEDFGGFIFDSGILFGSGVVHVDGDLLSNLGDFAWYDSNGDARLKSQVTGDSSFNSYLDQSYDSLVTTMWLYADESVVPEPATMLLLGLGGLLLRKRRA